MPDADGVKRAIEAMMCYRPRPTYFLVAPDLWEAAAQIATMRTSPALNDDGIALIAEPSFEPMRWRPVRTYYFKTARRVLRLWEEG